MSESLELEESASRYLEFGQHVLFALLLGLGAARATQGDGGSWPVLGAAGTGLWYVAGAVLGQAHRVRARTNTAPQTPRPRPWASRAGQIWFAGLILCWLGLLAVSSDFSWVAFALFLLAVHMLPTVPALALIGALTAVVIAVQITTGIGNAVGQVAGPIMGALVAGGAGLTYRRIIAESERRRRLVAQLVAAQDDLVVVHDELARTQREAGVLAERARLARDIHDTLAQGFSSIVLLSRAGLAADEDAARRAMSQIETTASENLDEARRVVHALTPAGLDAAPLPAALDRLVLRLREQTGIDGSLHVEGEVDRVGTTTEVALLRVAQSALANVRLHAHASRVVVSLTSDTSAITLDVVDDGRGFDPEALATAPLGGTSFGLRAMRERLAALGGTLEVDSAPGEGTTLSARIPSDRKGS